MIKRFVRHKNDDSSTSGSLNDLSFLLIIFFIVIAGFNVNRGFLLNLPSKEKPVLVNNEDILKCSLNAQGEIFLDGEKLNTEELLKKVQTKLSSWPNMTFLLTIDKDCPYQNVVDVISCVRNLKVENFSFKMK